MDAAKTGDLAKVKGLVEANSQSLNARALMPDQLLTYDKFKACGFDPNAAVLLARDVLAAKDGHP